MPPKFAGKNSKRDGAPSNPSRNSRSFAGCTDKSQFPGSEMPPKSSGNQGGRTVAGRKIKQVWRPKEKPCPPTPQWRELPRDITSNILHRLGVVEILQTAQKVCTTWRSVCKDPAMWRVIDMHNDGDLDDKPYNLVEMCRHAVDRSQDQLVEINLEHFATDELFDYIAARSGKLRRLRIVLCYNLSNGWLPEAITRFPNLESLDVSVTTAHHETIEKVGRCCPLLSSFALKKELYGFSLGIMTDEEAFTIARSMPELRHLQILGNDLTNAGVEAILDGCSHLESLVLGRCYLLKLEGALGKRLSSRIKCLNCFECSITDRRPLQGRLILRPRPRLD